MKVVPYLLMVGICAVACVVVSRASAEDLVPPTSQPLWKVVVVDDKGDLEITSISRVEKRVPETYTVEVPVKSTKIVDGEEKTVETKRVETRTRVVRSYVDERVTRRERNFELRRLDGARINVDSFPKGKQHAAIVLRGRAKLDPFYITILKPDTLVVTVTKPKQENRRVIRQPPPPAPNPFD